MQPTNKYTDNNRATLIESGGAYFALLTKLINNAVDTIYIQVYVFDDDHTGTLIADSLADAAARGVKVFFLVDGYGANTMRSAFLKKLAGSGVHFRWFRPVFSSRRFYFGRRLHNKVVVVDSIYALVGGRNISDTYNDLPGRTAWLDMSIYIEGETAYELEKVCVSMWNTFFSTTLSTVLTPEGIVYDRRRKLAIDTPCRISVRRNDWLKLKVEILRSYHTMFDHAANDIIVLGSYFLPGLNIRRQMEKSAARGVKIKVVVTGVSDVWLSKYAERYLYKWMLRNGIEVYEYTRNVLHAKLAVRDAEWMTIGSFNVNNISAHVSVELNVDVHDAGFVSSVHHDLEEMITRDCVRITEADHPDYFSVWNKIKARIAYEAVRLLLYLVTFYYRRPKQPIEEVGEYNY